MKRYHLQYVIAVAVISLLAAGGAAALDIGLHNSGVLKGYLDARIIGENAYVPVRGILDQFTDVDRHWSPLPGSLELKRGTRRVRVFPGIGKVVLDERLLSLDRPLMDIDGTAYVSIEFLVRVLSDFLNIAIDYRHAERILELQPSRRGFEPPDVKAQPPGTRTDVGKHFQPPRPLEGPKKIDDHRIRTVVIDPGHGGKDPGAVGRRGMKEKDAVLKLAHKVARLIRKNYPGITVLLTRDRDTFIPLEKRTEFANKAADGAPADLFISIHCNSGFSKQASGFETFYLDVRPSDDTARLVEKLENGVIKLEGKRKLSIDDDEFLLDAIKLGMAQMAYQEDSIYLSDYIQKGIGKKLNIPDRGVKSARFFVLKDALMPAVLVEAAFISNVFEESLLRKDWFLDNLAAGIEAGFAAYKKKVER